MSAALRLGTRGSQLALWQARTVAALLEARGATVEIVIIKTSGDRLQDRPLTEAGTKRLFVKEIEDAMLAGSVDLAVHSAKDMAASSPDGLTIAAVLPREDPRDALVLPVNAPAFDPAAATIGTGSPRRIAQLRRLWPAARFEPIRGNVDTRIRKLDAGEVSALVLACAGLRRLGLAGRISAPISPIDCVPAPGQGIIAVEVRRDDARAIELLTPMDDPAARTALAAEQAVVTELGGGCQLPLGVFAELTDGHLRVRACAASEYGTTAIEDAVTGDPLDPVEAGKRLGRQLALRGARELLQS